MCVRLLLLISPFQVIFIPPFLIASISFTIKYACVWKNLLDQLRETRWFLFLMLSATANIVRQSLQIFLWSVCLHTIQSPRPTDAEGTNGCKTFTLGVSWSQKLSCYTLSAKVEVNDRFPITQEWQIGRGHRELALTRPGNVQRTRTIPVFAFPLPMSQLSHLLSQREVASSWARAKRIGAGPAPLCRASLSVCRDQRTISMFPFVVGNRILTKSSTMSKLK